MDHVELLEKVAEKIDLKIDAQSKTLRSDIKDLRTSVDNLSGEIRGLDLRTRDLERSVDGVENDDTNPGLKTELKALEVRQRGDEELERDRVRDRKWLRLVAGAVGLLVTGTVLPTLGWYAGRIEATRDQVQTNDHELDLVKHRVERLEAAPDERLDAILEALERNDT